jgi:hypothetical protein
MNASSPPAEAPTPTTGKLFVVGAFFISVSGLPAGGFFVFFDLLLFSALAMAGCSREGKLLRVGWVLYVRVFGNVILWATLYMLKTIFLYKPAGYRIYLVESFLAGLSSFL